ncbi:MAG: PEP-CTERM sorting domain-containing protein [Armatimonadota bacterium]|nr:PEP-CTERM sorting domain-containing protein [Armatimonadota bacterium]
MKKVILLICAAALITSVAGAAMANADGSKIFLAFKAGWYDGVTTAANVTASFGASSSVATANGSIGASSFNVATTDGVSTGWITNKVEANTAGYTFTLVVAPGTGVSDHVGDPNANRAYISAWNLDSWTGLTGHTLPAAWVVNVSGANVVGGPQTWTAAQLFRATAPGTTAIGNVGFWYDYGGSHYTSYAAAVEAGQLFTVTIGPAQTPETPEPGSMLALGSGLVGMIGFAIRRRRIA